MSTPSFTRDAHYRSLAHPFQYQHDEQRCGPSTLSVQSPNSSPPISWLIMYDMFPSLSPPPLTVPIPQVRILYINFYITQMLLIHYLPHIFSFPTPTFWSVTFKSPCLVGVHLSLMKTPGLGSKCWIDSNISPSSWSARVVPWNHGHKMPSHSDVFELLKFLYLTPSLMPPSHLHSISFSADEGLYNYICSWKVLVDLFSLVLYVLLAQKLTHLLRYMFFMVR